VNSTKKIAVSVAAAAAGVAIGAFVMSSANADSQATSPPQKAAPHYAKNANGLTYGSNMDANSPDNLPDLIKAVATNGKEGYVKRTDYDDPHFTNPADAVKWTMDQKGKTRTIPVYDVDGVTKIGEFVIHYPG
jgi:hypothetical protein